MYCCIFGCKNNSRNFNRFYGFPTKQKIREQWIGVCGRPKTFNPNKHSRICRKHFRDCDFTEGGKERKRLKSGTIPTINLPVHTNNPHEIQNQNENTTSQFSFLSLSEEQQNNNDKCVKTIDPFSANIPPSSIYECSNSQNIAPQKFVICRLCMTTEESNEFQEIPWSDWQNHESINKFINITGIKFQLSNEFPEFICKECINWINATTKQIQIFQEVEKFWNSHVLSKNETETSITKPERVDYIDIEYLPEEVKLELTDAPNFIANLLRDDDKSYNLVDNSNEIDIEEKKIELVNIWEKNKIISEREIEQPQKKRTKRKLIANKFVRRTCPYCNEAFVSNLACLNHAREVHDPSFDRDGESICYYCDFSFPLKSTLSEHMDLIHRGYSKNQFCCKMCKTSYVNYERFRLHIRLAHLSDVTFECYICKTMYRQKNHLRKHIYSTHMADRKCVCDVCGLVFATMGSLKRHNATGQLGFCRKRRRPRREQAIQCTLCNSRYVLMEALRTHMKKKHLQVGSDEYKRLSELWCTKCNLKFNSIEERDLHKKDFHTHDVQWKMEPRGCRSVPKDNYFQCDICKQYLCSELSLEIHQSLHPLKDRPFKCTDCGASYIRRPHLTEHIRRAHSNERPYKCSLCDWTFTSKCEINSHNQRVHLRIMKHHCKFCERAFTTKPGLTYHTRVNHTREYKCACKTCDKKFFDLNQYHLHLLRCK